MTPIIHSYAVMAATGHIGSVVAELPLLALSLAAALAFVLGCARPAEEADDTTTEALVAARDAAPSPSAKAPALPPPFHTESAARFPKVIRWPEGKTPAAPAGFESPSTRTGSTSPLALRPAQRRRAGGRGAHARSCGGEIPEPVRKASRARASSGPRPTASRCCATPTATASAEVRETFLGA